MAKGSACRGGTARIVKNRVRPPLARSGRSRAAAAHDRQITPGMVVLTLLFGFFECEAYSERTGSLPILPSREGD